MTAPHPVQLHLFDANPEPATVPPERRRRLLRLIGELLQEAAQSETRPGEAIKVMETIDE